jgi:hypothetical protein
MSRGADAIIPANLPAGFDCYFGYVDGSWPDWLAIVDRFPGVPVFGLVVAGDPWDGDGTDTEPGALTIAQGVIDTGAELARGVDRPIVYCPASWSAKVIEAHTAAGIARPRYRLGSAHWTKPHICGPLSCGLPPADATQWVDHGGWDEWLLYPSFLTAAPHPGPSAFRIVAPAAPAPLPEVTVNAYPALEDPPMPGIIAEIPIGPDGVGWAVFDGGIKSDPGSVSLKPAIPFDKLVGASPWCDDPAHDAGPATPSVGVQDRNGWVFVKATGAAPGAATPVAYVVFTP